MYVQYFPQPLFSSINPFTRVSELSCHHYGVWWAAALRSAMKCTSVSNHKPRKGAPREATAALLPQQGPAATTPLAPPAASGPHNATPHPPPITATAKLPPCVKCSRGFLDITELLRQGLPSQLYCNIHGIYKYMNIYMHKYIYNCIS